MNKGGKEENEEKKKQVMIENPTAVPTVANAANMH